MCSLKYMYVKKKKKKKFLTLFAIKKLDKDQNTPT